MKTEIERIEYLEKRVAELSKKVANFDRIICIFKQFKEVFDRLSGFVEY